MSDYTLVVGVDEFHLRQLSLTWPTWKRHKPSLLDHPMVIFFDWRQISMGDVRSVVDHPNLKIIRWPEQDSIEYKLKGTDKWNDEQRYRMLAGFVHVPSEHVGTEYMLKLDTDVVATGQDDWIDGAWFDDKPAIVCQPWGFTKPADQMLKLDEWAKTNDDGLGFGDTEPLNLAPNEGSDRVCHKRIISWCGFFHSRLVQLASRWAERTCGTGQLPVRSQDGYLWYVATRLRMPVRRAQMKSRGWQHWSTMHNVQRAASEAMKNKEIMWC